MYNLTIDNIEIIKHKYFLNKKFKILCNNIIFTEDERDILTKYGVWMHALENGVIKAISKAQEHFIEVCNNDIQPNTEYEKVWIKYKRRIQWEKKNGNIYNRKPIKIPRHWEGLCSLDIDFNKTYQI